MSLVTQKYKTPNGTNYSYVHAAPQSSHPYLLFLHGFPETSYDWTPQTTYFAEQGYGIICPDLLGYGGTDKPTDYHEYRQKRVGDDVVSILDHHGIGKCVPIGHDWGSVLLASLAWFHRERFSAFMFLSAGYNPPGAFDIDTVNEQAKAMLGYEAMGYFLFFNTPEAAGMLEAKPESTTSLLFSQQPRHWATNLCPIGAARAWIETGKTAPLPSWFSEEMKQRRDKIFAQGGFTGPLNWYKQMMHGVNKEDEAQVREELKQINNVPVLFIGDEQEGMMPSEILEQRMVQTCKDLRIARVKAGHWAMWEDAQGVNAAIEDFVKSLDKV